MKYRLTLQFDDVFGLQRAIEAVASVTPAVDPTVTKVDDAAANENPRKAHAKKNGKTAAVETAEVEDKPAEGKPAEGKSDPIDSLAQALKICRFLLESGNEDAKKDLKALRDELGVKKLSDVPPEGSAVFLAKAQALEDKHAQ